jgi:hypothetical protein
MIHEWCRQWPKIEFYGGREKNAEIEWDAWAAAIVRKNRVEYMFGCC